MRRLALLLLAPLALLPVACEEVGPQTSVVAELNERTQLVQVACLDANGDGRVNADDAGAGIDRDLTGDGAVDEADLDLVRRVDLPLPDGRPEGCAEGNPAPDWQIGPPPEDDCWLLVVAVGGGAVTLDNVTNAAGVRWMLSNISEELDDRDIPHQIASVAPGLNGTADPNADAEAWTVAYLTSQFDRHPCLVAAIYGHSHGGVVVTAVTARLEELTYTERVVLTALIDRVDVVYGGDTRSFPQEIPVFNIYQTNEGFTGEPIDQRNVENWDASNAEGPEGGEEGGELRRVTHTTLDNSPDALREIEQRIVQAACLAELC
jgi:hypothetical protein